MEHCVVVLLGVARREDAVAGERRDCLDERARHFAQERRLFVATLEERGADECMRAIVRRITETTSK